MGGRRGTPGNPGPLSYFDLRGEADAFAAQLTDLLNRTVTHGIRIVAVTGTGHAGRQARIGYQVPRRDLGDIELIPLILGRGRPNLYLGLLFRMEADEAGRYPMIRSSVMFLSPDADIGGRVLLHYDYERDKEDDYPDAHLQVCAASDAWDEVSRRHRGSVRPLEKLHLPVGGRRYRPTLEDLIEFLIVEKLAKGRAGWRRHVEQGRNEFEERQLRAAVRRNPDAAMAVLRDEGLI